MMDANTAYKKARRKHNKEILGLLLRINEDIRLAEKEGCRAWTANDDEAYRNWGDIRWSLMQEKDALKARLIWQDRPVGTTRSQRS